MTRKLRVPKPLETPVPTVSGADVGHRSGEVCDPVKTPGREEHTCHPVLGSSRPVDWVRKSLCGKEEGRKEGGEGGRVGRKHGEYSTAWERSRAVSDRQQTF